ncbi:patatin-like phospholipase family protein [Bacillus gaemokensis]|uniref:patatin-like phospholipase family protein n=1 Tax=Bacillus gaemokensis TaxID=574375 RepID=UPI00068BC7D8|nr:patatin-like phospholipase family protein [Bacillus gaemokensis]KYG32555.1 hypothetical protein AZF08_10620 [Bacillus gaemokensis]
MSVSNLDKLGLALSGGGFRAAFFHLGVLAKMANLGLLRHVEVISTVSGGSIIGALYYLHIKKLLENKTDDEISDEDYQEIIEKIEIDFLRAVQRNFRLYTFLNPLKNLKMSLPNYSRSDCIGELYDKYLYRNVLDHHNNVPIKMKDLKIKPLGEECPFDPIEGNKNRKAKVPILVMNATVLNDGHNWNFSVGNMGETNVEELNKTLDKNLRLKPVKSYENVYKHGGFELGWAVAASACLPGVFAPLAISGLYDEGIRVQLVDGGAHDNQGVIGLLDNKLKCTYFIISDASGQLNDEKEPGVEIPSVLKRTNNIFMDRIREQQLSRIIKEHSDNVALLHLKKGLPIKEISYYDKEHKLCGETISHVTEPSSEVFGVNEEVQDFISKIRTDLDSFSEVEAYSLMLDGYKMSGYEFDKTNIKNLICNKSLKEKKYQFFKMEKWVSSSIADSYYRDILEAAGKRFFRTFRISLLVKIIITLSIICFCFTLVHIYGASFEQWRNEPVTKGRILLLVVLLIFLVSLYLNRYGVSYQNQILQFLLSGIPTAILSLMGSALIWIHLLTFNRLFLYLESFTYFEKKQVIKKK